MKTNDENNKLGAENSNIKEKIERFVPSLEKIDQGYFVLPLALSQSKVNKLLNELEKIPYSKEEINETEEILLKLLDEVAKNDLIQAMSKEAEEKKKDREKRGIVTGEDELLSIADLKLGIEKLFIYLDNNTNIVSSPEDQEERKILYKNFKKGFRYIAEIMKEEFLERKTLEPIDLYGNLDIIANASNHCAMRWNDTLTHLVNNFKSRILERGDIEVEKSNDPLVVVLKDVFLEAKTIEVEKMAEKFVQEIYGREIKEYGEGNIPHYVWIFKKEVDSLYNLNLPLMDSKDSYIEYGDYRGMEVSSAALDFMADVDLLNLVFERACQILSDRIKVDKKLCDNIIDWAGRYFDNNKFDLIIEDGKSEFLQEYIFTDVFSYQIGEFAMRELMMDKGFIEIDPDYLDTLDIYSEDEIMLKKVIRCLECMKRDGDRRVWEEIENEEEFFSKNILELWSKSDKKEELFPMFIKNMPDKIFKDKYNDGYKLLNIEERRQNNLALHEISKEIFNRGLLRYDNESVADMFNVFLTMGTNEKTEQMLTDLVKNANVNVSSSPENINLLIVASYHGMTDLVEQILDKDAININTVDFNGWNALYWAGEKNNIETVQFLINRGIDINATDFGACNALHWAVKEDNFELSKILIENGIDVNVMEKEGSLPLHWAIKNKNIKLVELLLDNKAELNRDCKELGVAPIHLAVGENSIEILKILIKNGVQINMKDNDGDTSLHIAIKNDLAVMTKFLIENKADIDIKDRDGRTPFYWACSVGNLDIMEMLLKNKADINLIDNLKGSVLHYAVEDGNVQLVKFLIKNGADVEVKNKNGVTPMEIAAKSNKNSIIFLLENSKRLRRRGESLKKIEDKIEEEPSREI